jgi:hypothetical protein
MTFGEGLVMTVRALAGAAATVRTAHTVSRARGSGALRRVESVIDVLGAVAVASLNRALAQVKRGGLGRFSFTVHVPLRYQVVDVDLGGGSGSMDPALYKFA